MSSVYGPRALATCILIEFGLYSAMLSNHNRYIFCMCCLVATRASLSLSSTIGALHL